MWSAFSLFVSAIHCGGHFPVGDGAGRSAPWPLPPITIEGPVAGPNALRLQGVLSTRHTYDSVIDDDPVQPLGRRTKDGWWVKCRGQGSPSRSLDSKCPVPPRGLGAWGVPKRHYENIPLANTRYFGCTNCWTITTRLVA